MEKKEKIKKEKAPKAKKSKMPEGYIGRPKPMKTKSFEFHKPTVVNYIEMVIGVLAIAFVTYIVVRLVDVSKLKDPAFSFYALDEAKANEEFVLENKDLKFQLNPENTTFTVVKKSNGHIWKSNPDNVDADPIALGKEKNNMKSTLLVKYSTENGVNNVYDTYSYCIDKKFYSIDKTKDSIAVNYTIGQIEREYQYPLAIYEPDMKKYLAKMSKADQNVITKRCYRLVDIKKLKASDNKEELLQKYPGLADDKLYMIFDPLNAYLKVDCERIFNSIGFTAEEYATYKEIYKEKNEKEVPAFNVTIVYKLDGDKLVVDVPFDKISYKRTYPITQLTVLPFFGSAGTSDNGFMFIPEGGGSIINFNNGKTKQNGYYADVYGWDYGLDRKAVVTETRIAFPVFGAAFEDSSFISIIENGAEYANITSDISGKLSSFNYVRAEYTMLHSEQFEVSSRSTSAQYSYEKGLPAGEKITQVYKFVDSNSYVDMAKAYQNYLFAGEKKLNNSSTPIAIEVIGAIDKVQQVAGMPKTKPYKLTTYKETAEIIKEVEEMGIKDAHFKLSGYFNEGIRQKLLKKFKLIKVLGGKSGFNSMVESTKDSSSKIYLDGTLQFAYRTGFLNGFNRFTDASRFVSSEVCELNEFSPIWYGKLDTVDTYYYIKPSLTNRAADIFTKKANQFKFDGISYRDNGYILSADYNDHDPVSRAASKNNQVKKMEEAKASGLGIMINAGNAYAVKNADFITNMNLHGNSYAIIDEQVPFYQIALRGYRNFAGSPVNLGYENDQIVLEAAESGAGLYYTVMKASEKALQETMYTEYYAACFDSLKDQIANTYNRYNSEFKPVGNSTISNYEKCGKNVSKTTFENGYVSYVNFGYVDFTTESGMVIPARDYKVVKEGK